MEQLLNFFEVTTLAFACYYAGILIRFFGLPGPDALPLRQQLLIGIVISIGIVTPLLSIMQLALSESSVNPVALLATVGVIMEHGFAFNDTLAKHLQRIVRARLPPGTA